MEQTDIIEQFFTMDAKILAAIISSIISFLIAIISLFNSNKALRRNLQYQKQLEEHKLKQNTQLEETKIKLLQELESSRNAALQELEKLKTNLRKEVDENTMRLELRKQELDKSLTALEDGISHIQNIKDALQLFLNAIPNKINLKIPSMPIAPNILNRDFEVSEPGRVWVSDITYIRLRDRFVYLTTVIAAFEKALNNRPIEPGLIFHSSLGGRSPREMFALLTLKKQTA